MAYIGRSIEYGNAVADHFTGNGGATYTLSYDTVTNGVVVSLDGVVQKNGTDFNVTGTSLVFTSVVASPIAIQVIYTGLTLTFPTPSDGSVTDAKITAMAASKLTGTIADARFPATLPAASGVNLTAVNASNLGSGTVPTARLGSGTASSSTFLRGDQTYAEAGGGGFASQQVFTSGGTWTKPSGINLVKVYVTGAGGGGGGGQSNYNKGGAGGAGGTSIKVIDVSSISSETVTIGLGGAGGGSAGADGVTGGTSSFGSHCSSTGGYLGNGADTTPASTDGKGGVGSSGDINLYGGQGSSSEGGNVQDGPNARTGASSFWGGGGYGGNPYQTFASSAGLAYGSGGGAGSHGTGTSMAGAAGAGGLVVVEEYK